MENNENFVEQTENVEQTTEQTPKMFTQDEVNDIVGKSKARERAKITKQFERKYGQLEEVLKAGTGKGSVEELTDTFTDFYTKKGVQIRKPTEYSDNDLEVLANADAQEIINAGSEDVVDEVERLSSIGIENMTAREKKLFTALADHRQSTERGMELSKLGVTEDVYNSKEFNDFASQFKAGKPISEIYEIYAKTQPKPNIKPMGSMKSTSPTDNGLKDFYTPEEAKKFTAKELRDNPALEQRLIESMQKWR